MQRLLADVWRETRKTVIYVTHNVAEAVYLADRVIVMQEGRIVAEFTRGAWSAEAIVSAATGAEKAA